MEVEAVHKDNYEFEFKAREHSFFLDGTSINGIKERGPTPKEALLSAIIGCSGMDVFSLLKKYNVSYSSFKLKAIANLTKEHPKVFPQIEIQYHFQTDHSDQSKIIEAITLSMTKYCGVSAMISKSAPIYYKIFINDEVHLDSEANFENIV